jgi:hypothetical protein
MKFVKALINFLIFGSLLNINHASENVSLSEDHSSVNISLIADCSEFRQEFRNKLKLFF